MTSITLLIVGLFLLTIGSVLGYLARQSIALKQKGTIEEKLQKRIAQVREESDQVVNKAKSDASGIINQAKEEEEKRRKELLRIQEILLKRENLLEKRISDYEQNEKDLQVKVKKVQDIRTNLETMEGEVGKKLETASGLSKEEAKKELLSQVERESEKELLEKMRRLEQEGEEKMEKRAKEIIAIAIQKYALPQAQEITTTTVSIPSEDIKGKIIGKEGRNIRTLEKLTGVEVLIDETPETVIISGFDPVRRQIAKSALEKLIKDGRIQPARIEQKVEEAQNEIVAQIKEAGEQAIYDTGILSLHPKLVQLLGRLKFRTSYGQNVLLHSIEVAHLASALASEVGADASVCKKAGLLHDIGKAVDHQIEGSHVDIGIKILEKFNVEKEVISAMKSHHEEYPVETLEAIIVQSADQISGARPGARKDSLENYIKRLKELEDIAVSFKGVEKAYAVQAGREVRVFVRPGEVDDLMQAKMAKEIAQRIREDLSYPGEIKVIVIRENRVVEFAR